MDPATAASIGKASSDVIGRGLDYFSDKGMDAHEAMKHQRQFAQNQIQWKVADAKAAGIHPLYALGAPTISPSVAVGGGGPSLGETLSGMGADVSRAVAARQTDAERALQQLTLDKAALENDYLREQIASIRNRTIRESAPPVPGLIPEKVVPPQRTTGVNVGLPFKSNPYFSDAQSYEDRYGELGGSILGLGNIPADVTYNVIDAYVNSKGKSAAREIYDYLLGGR